MEAAPTISDELSDLIKVVKTPLTAANAGAYAAIEREEQAAEQAGRTDEEAVQPTPGIGHNRGPNWRGRKRQEHPDPETPPSRLPLEHPPPAKVGYRIHEWCLMTGTSRTTTWRRVKDKTLRTKKYGGVTLILGFADQVAAE